MTRVYAGIGSRRTPPDVLELMATLARRLLREGWTLRTGGASGADEAFMLGAGMFPKSIDLYLPWPGFRAHTSCRLAMPSERAIEIAKAHHPAWRSLNGSARSLVARNTHQILGADCASPSAFVLCWTPDGAETETDEGTGGTGQAIRVAVACGIPVWNLARKERREQIVSDLGALLATLQVPKNDPVFVE